jgi:arylsulfatase A-like enzyme
MKTFITPIKGLCYSLMIGAFCFNMQSCNNYATTLPEGKFPDSFTRNTPDDMDKWYDGDTLNGEIEEDVRASIANWDGFSPKVAPATAPNILFILYDDTGFGAWSPYGGKIKMPTMDALAADGLIYTQWHTTALCSPTRSTIMTGRNHHLNGMASITETADGFPGANGRLPDNCMPFAELLQNSGYSTFWVGKNHNVPEVDVAPGGYRGSWPCQMGFDRFYGFLGGETNNWYPDLVEDNHFIEAPYTPEEGYHLSKDLTDQAIKMLRDQNASNPSKPWYMWFCPGANHAPHHCPDSSANVYRDEGTFAAGYDVYREDVLEEMVKLGVLPSTTTITALNFLDSVGVANPSDYVTPWVDLTDKEQALFIRMAEVYAGFSTYTDYKIGQIIDYLKESDQYENTIILYAADNGASGEGTPNGSVNENKFFNGYPDDIDENIEKLDVLGSRETYNHFPTGWAAAFSSPFKMFKRYSQFAGGTNDPLVITWPKYIQKDEIEDNLRHQYHHSVDIIPTLIEAINSAVDDVDFIAMPDTYQGVVQKPLSGKSMFYTFDNDLEPDAKTKKKVQYYCMLGTRGVWQNGWKAVALHAPTSGKSGFDKDVWELYHVDEDRSESNNLADSLPGKLDSLKDEWYKQAAINNVLPLDDRAAEEMFMVERPNPERPRKIYRYYPKTTAVPEGVAVNIRGRSYTIEATVTITDTTRGAIFAHGSRFGGHTMFIKDGELHYLYNFLGIEDMTSDVKIARKLVPGTYIFKAHFERDKDYDDTTNTGTSEGLLTLSAEVIDGSKIIYNNSSKIIHTQPAKFTLSGDGLCVGYDSADPIIQYVDDKGEFIGGRIKYVEVKVRGNPVLNREAAAKRAMLRE